MKKKSFITTTLAIFLISILGIISLGASPQVAYADLNLELPDLNLPDLGAPPASSIIYAGERESGLKILRKLRSRGNLIEDPEINAWIQSLGNRLVTRAPQTGNPFYFVVSKSKAINAFATIGSVVLINAGLIIKTDNESELAAVLSHEIAHVTQRHIARMIEKSKQGTFSKGAALLAGVIAGTKNPQAGQAIISTTIAASMHKQLSFNREAESEADRVGLSILSSSGYDPQGMPQFLQKLEQLSSNKYADITEYVQSHPLPHKRVVDSQLRANKLGSRPRKDHPNYLYMREKIRAQLKPDSSAPNKTPPRVKKYAQALKLEKTGQYAPALNLLGHQSKQPSEVVLIARLLNKQRKFKQAIQLILPLTKTYPNNAYLSLPLAEAYLGLGQRPQAWNSIKNVNIKELTSLEFFEVRQQVAHTAGQNAEAYRSAAERNIRMGEYKYAIIQLRKAIKLPDTNPAQINKFQQILSSIENIKKKKR